jgi:hypothetical protein
MTRRVVAALLAGVAAVASLSLSSLPAVAAPGAPALSLPASAATTPTNPELKWLPVAGAVKYDVQVATQSDYASGTVKFTQTTANTSSTPPNDLAVGTYWWRVRALDAAGAASAFSASRTFVKSTVAAPTPTTPADGAVLKYPSESLTLSWDAMPGIKSYDVQIDDDAGFVGAANPVSTSNTSYTPTNPPFGTTYFWRVRGKSAQGVPTQFSDPRSYSMEWVEPSDTVNGAKPVLVSPANTTASSIEQIELNWQPLRGASAYELQISPDEFFNSPIGGTRIVNGTAFSPSPTLPAGSYYWRVRGRNTSATPEPGPWSATWVFTRAWPATTASSRPLGTQDNRYAQVTLLEPANADYTTLTEPVFSWNPQRETAEYEFNVGTDPNFSPATYSVCRTNHTVYSPYTGPSQRFCSPPKLTPGSVLYWRVRAVDDLSGTDVFGLYSEVRSFLYDPAYVVQTSPANGATVDVPILRWEAAKNISHYKVTISPVVPVSGCATITAVTYNTTFVPLTLSASCTGEMAWTVQSMEEDDQLSRIRLTSTWPRFTIVPPAAGASLGTVTATSFEATRAPLLQWSRVTNAVEYHVYFSIAGANTYSQAMTKTNQPAFAYTGKDGTAWPAVLAPGSYSYFVEARSAVGVVLDTSSVGQFTVGAWPKATLLGPALCLPNSEVPCALHDTPTLDWEAMSNVGLYKVYIATDPNFTNILKDWTTSFSELTPVESLPDSQAGEAYYWYVRPCYTATTCAPFDSSVFPDAGAFRKESVPVAALSPQVSGAGVVPTIADEITFTWTDYLTSVYPFNGTTPGGSTVPEVATQEALGYEVQVSTTAEFTNIVETSPLVDQTTYTAQTKTYPEGVLYWRVRAVDASGNPLTYSCAPVSTRTQPACDTLRFEKKSLAPVQTSPANGGLVNSAPTMSWNPMAFARSYDVEVYRDPSAALNSTNRVVSLSTRSNSALANTPLSKGTYGWRVRRVDVNNLPGRWTTETNTGLRTFTVAGPAPSLLLPAVGATVNPANVVLTWTPVNGASRYKVEVSRDNWATVLESATTDMTAWAPGLISIKWPGGSYSWRVTSLDGSGNPLATSAPRAFTMGGPIQVTLRGQRLFSPIDFSGDAKSDVMQIASNGDLMLYTGTGSGTLNSTPTKLGPGWGPFLKAFSPGDFSGDGKSDVLAVSSSGGLYLYKGNGAGGFGAAGVKVGTGWATFKFVFSPGDFSGDGKADVLAVNSVGNLYLYKGNGAGGWAAGGVKIGGGWGSFAQVLSPRDFTGDAKADVMSVTTSGALYLYRGNGTGGFAAGGVAIGGGFSTFPVLFGPGDMTGDLRSDLLALNKSGDLFMYAGNGAGGFAAAGQKVAVGF